MACTFNFYIWSNDRQVKDLESFDSLEIKPVNLDERLGFILSQAQLISFLPTAFRVDGGTRKTLCEKKYRKKASKPTGLDAFFQC